MLKRKECDIMAIELLDGRQLSDEVLKALRLRALHGCEQGFTEDCMADLLGVVRETVSRWWSAYVKGGLDAIPQDRSGRPLGLGRTLDDEQGLHIQSLMNEHSPDEHGIASPLWTRRAVRDLIHKEYGIEMPIRTVGEYLRRWGYTPKKPRRKALHQDPEEVQEWLEKTYPAIEEVAKKEEGEILWCDEKGVGANDFPGRGYVLVGQTPEIKVSSSPSRMNLITTISNEGEVRFMTYKETMTATLFLVFLTRLIQAASRKVFLIVDRLPAHGADLVEVWLRGREGKIEMFYLPRRAPELNPVEYLNNEVKSVVNATKLPENEKELRSNLQRLMHKLAKLPAHIMSYFDNPFIQYAAGPM
jgi:transposase